MNPKLKTTLGIVAFFILVMLFEGYGVIGFLVFILAIAGYKMYLMREMLKGGMRNIETSIFGKPLDKESWEKGELKNTKIQITFKNWKQNLKLLISKPFLIAYAWGIGILVLIKLVWS